MSENKEVTNVVEELKNAGLYDDVIKELEALMDDTQINYPVPLFTDYHGNMHRSINGVALRTDVEIIHHLLMEERVTMKDLHKHDLSNLYVYFNDKINMMSRNYIVSLAHRKSPETTITKFRTLLTISHMIITAMSYDENDDAFNNWKIPNGWHKLSDDDLKVDDIFPDLDFD